MLSSGVCVCVKEVLVCPLTKALMWSIVLVFFLQKIEEKMYFTRLSKDIQLHHNNILKEIFIDNKKATLVTFTILSC